MLNLVKNLKKGDKVITNKTVSVCYNLFVSMKKS